MNGRTTKVNGVNRFALSENAETYKTRDEDEDWYGVATERGRIFLTPDEIKNLASHVEAEEKWDVERLDAFGRHPSGKDTDALEETADGLRDYAADVLEDAAESIRHRESRETTVSLVRSASEALGDARHLEARENDEESL